MNLDKLVNHLKYDKIFEQCTINGKINWSLVANYNNLPIKFIDKYFFQLKKYKIEEKQKFNQYIMIKYFSHINWFLLSSFQEIPEEIIEKFIKKFDKRVLISIIKYQKLSLNFLIKNKNLFNESYYLKALEQNFYINDSTKTVIKNSLL